MNEIKRRKVFAEVDASDFIGRSRELEALMRHAKDAGAARGLLVLSPPSAGSSELLRQAYDRFFFLQGDLIPFYFAFSRSDKSLRKAAMRFVRSFIQQTVAFRRCDPKILDISIDVSELAELAVPGDGYWIDRLVESCRVEGRFDNGHGFVDTCLTSPLRAMANGARILVMIDDLHETAHLEGGEHAVELLASIFSRSSTPFVFAGRRRFLSTAGGEGFDLLNVGPLSFSDAGLLAENLAGSRGLTLPEQVRDLIAVQFGGNPLFIRSLMLASAERGIAPESFQRLEQLYVDELFGGRIGKYYDSVFSEISTGIETQKNLIGLVYDALTIEREKTHVEAWRTRTGLDGEEFTRAMCLLNENEVISLTTNLAEAPRENTVLVDYITSRFRLEVISQNRALTVGEMLTDSLKRAPKLMSEYYRRNSAVGLRELLSAFNCQEVPAALLDYGSFFSEYKGAPDDEVLKELSKSDAKVFLPQIVYTAHTVAFYSPIGQVVERERSAVALGFIESAYTDEDETVWIAAEIDSKLEASREVAEFWCDRLEMVALMCNFVKFKIWLVAPEGFSPEAAELLAARGAYGSSRRQVALLITYLGAEGMVGEKLRPNEYEMVVPMGDDTELIAAQAVEEIARRHNFTPKAINQIKTALVEACINAAEHSQSPDRKIYQKFSVEDGKFVITISNRGLRLKDKQAREINPTEGRRGWGLKLMKTLMDEVKIEQTDDGTRIRMVKNLEQ